MKRRTVKLGLSISAGMAMLACIALHDVSAKSVPNSKSGDGKSVAVAFLLPNVIYYGGVLARNLQASDKQVLALKVPATGKNAWDEAVQEKLPDTIAQGDTMLATFRIRVTHPTANASVVFNAEGPAPGYAKSVSQVINLNDRWKKVSIPFKSKVALPKGTGDFDFWLDTVPQEVEIADFRVISYGTSRKVSSLQHEGY